MEYQVVQVTLNKEKFLWTGAVNLSELENEINKRASEGYRLHTITTASAGDDRLQATIVFEKINA